MTASLQSVEDKSAKVDAYKKSLDWFFATWQNGYTLEICYKTCTRNVPFNGIIPGAPSHPDVTLEFPLGAELRRGNPPWNIQAMNGQNVAIYGYSGLTRNGVQ